MNGKGILVVVNVILASLCLLGQVSSEYQANPDQNDGEAAYSRLDRDPLKRNFLRFGKRNLAVFPGRFSDELSEFVDDLPSMDVGESSLVRPRNALYTTAYHNSGIGAHVSRPGSPSLPHPPSTMMVKRQKDFLRFGKRDKNHVEEEQLRRMLALAAMKRSKDFLRFGKK